MENVLGKLTVGSREIHNWKCPLLLTMTSASTHSTGDLIFAESISWVVARSKAGD